ncbi:MAG: hypothetical protein IKZ39_09050, partial [Lachnospiraceae bacterium]|nr:hypothetical protein [Lachnospiraceae bacterium]
MNRRSFNKDLLSNIEITDDVKQELLENCKRGKRTSDFRFKYAKVITTLIIFGVVGSTGITANALYKSVKSRLENMPEAERSDYVYVLENDDEVTMTGNWSRNLSDSEVLRMAELERSYNAQALFPTEEVKHVKALSDWDGCSVCFVEEDNKLHFPEKEMNDEQLLQLIDYSAKLDYVIEEEAKGDAETAGVQKPYIDVDSATEQDIINLGYGYLKDFFGKDLPDGYTASVQAFVPSRDFPSEVDRDMYFIYWRQDGGTSVSTSYVVVLGMYDLSFRVAAVQGREYEATLKSYTEKEALEIAETAKPKIYKVLADKLGYKTIDRERHETVETYDATPDDVRQLRYVFQSGEAVFEIYWDISDEKLSMYELWPEGDSFEPE